VSLVQLLFITTAKLQLNAPVFIRTLALSLLLYWWTPWWSVAVLTTWCQTSLSFAFLRAVWTQKFNDWRSSSIVFSQVVLGRPSGLIQSTQQVV